MKCGSWIYRVNWFVWGSLLGKDLNRTYHPFIPLEVYVAWTVLNTCISCSSLSSSTILQLFARLLIEWQVNRPVVVVVVDWMSVALFQRPANDIAQKPWMRYSKLFSIQLALSAIRDYKVRWNEKVHANCNQGINSITESELIGTFPHFMDFQCFPGNECPKIIVLSNISRAIILLAIFIFRIVTANTDKLITIR